MATRQELEEYWSMNDYLDAIDYLDFTEDVDAFYSKPVKAKSGER